jgi:hypothetical protein
VTVNLEACPSCGSGDLRAFYCVSDVPANSVLLLPNRERALSFPVGNIRLHRCDCCGFVFNAAFDSALTEYSGQYESTQAFSSTFVRFSEELAADLIQRHGIHNQTILEIGCGDGDFLRQLCALGANQGVGYDPAYDPGRHRPVRGVTFIPELFKESSPNHGASLVVCKMTLEHISDVGAFVGLVRAALRDSRETVVFFQVPNARYVFGAMAFWDVYYEHCSYFSAVSLASLFRCSGFDVLRTWTGYDDQYLMLEARPTVGIGDTEQSVAETVEDVRAETEQFGVLVGENMAEWRTRVRDYRSKGKRVALWGAGSKAVAFLAALGSDAPIEITVDINPHKAGTFLPGTGHEIMSPSSLTTAMPDVVIVMNPIYLAEIRRDLGILGLDPEVLTV